VILRRRGAGVKGEDAGREERRRTREGAGEAWVLRIRMSGSISDEYGDGATRPASTASSFVTRPAVRRASG